MYSLIYMIMILQSGEALNHLSEEVLQQIKAHSTLAHGAITDVIKQGIEQGDFIDEHPVALADVLWASYAGIVLWVDSKRLLNDQKNFVKPTLKTAFKIITKGLKQE